MRDNKSNPKQIPKTKFQTRPGAARTFGMWNSRFGLLDFSCSPRVRASIVATAVCVILSTPAKSQDNYEIQVYGSETMPAGHTMIELHSNYTLDGQRERINGVLPSNHAFHETLEITQGFTPWFETGFY